MTKPQIIGRLLQEGHITEEEAVVLLGGTKEIVIRHEHEYTPVYPTVPYQPVQPWPDTTPDYVRPPYFVTCDVSDNLLYSTNNPNEEADRYL